MQITQFLKDIISETPQCAVDTNFTKYVLLHKTALIRN